MAIPRDFTHTLLARVDIVDVVERRIALKKTGSNLSACCPFHNEKTASFTVSPVKQFFHCFGCGAHGNAIDFVMQFHGVGFVDAVKELAHEAGLTVPEDARYSARDEGKGDLLAVLSRAAEFFRVQLKQSERAVAYLKGRGLTGETAVRFGIGYAPDSWQSLAQVFPDYQDKALLEAGLVIDADSGRRYDRFRDRAMFPIRNSRGEVIGFGGRVIGEGEPKYLNSPETPVFSKGRELYGAFEAREAIRGAGKVIVVEGYMDVVGLSQAGAGYAVGTLGTATTPAHVERLLRLADEVVFCFDGDAAGRRAAWRALEVSLPVLQDGKRVGFVFLPEGDDPDTYVLREGRPAFENLLAGATPLSEFFVKELAATAGVDTEEGKAALISRARGLVKEVRAPALGLLLRRRLAETVGIDFSDLNRLFVGSAGTSHRRLGPAPQGRTPPNRWWKLFRALVARPDLACRVDPALIPDTGGDAARVGILVEILRDGIATPAELWERVRGTTEEAVVSQASREVMALGEGFEAEPEIEAILASLVADRARAEAAPVPAKPSDLSEEGKRGLVGRVSRAKPD